MTNEIIGIVGALVLTLLLFVLRRLVLPSERANTRRQVPRTTRENRELDNRAIDDNAWLLWTPDLETEAQRRTRFYEDNGH